MRNLTASVALLMVAVLPVACAGLSGPGADSDPGGVRVISGLERALWDCVVRLPHGSGWVLHSTPTSAYVVTAYHVVDNAPTHDIRFWNRGNNLIYQGLVIFFNEPRDIAVLFVPNIKNGPIPALKLAARNPPTMTPVLAAGVLYDVNRIQLPAGMMWGRVIDYGEVSAQRPLQDDIVISASAWYGFSGGPIMDASTGLVVGLIQRKAVPPNGSNRTGGLHVHAMRAWLKKFTEFAWLN